MNGVIDRPLKIVVTPPSVIAILLSRFASTLSNELKNPQSIRATVFEIPMADIRYAPSFLPHSVSDARLFRYMNGTKNPIMHRKPLMANSINDGDFNNDISNIVANVRRTASGHILQLASTSWFRKKKKANEQKFQHR